MARWTPAWSMHLDPSRRWLVTSYTSTVAERSVRAVRNFLEEHPGRCRITKATESYIETSGGGCVVAAGITGSITGLGFTDIVVDDPYSGPEEANSPAHREKVRDAFYSVILTRLARGGNLWGIATRWSYDDLFGGLTAGGGYDVTVLPAFAHADDPLGRAEGEVLCPELHTAEEWKALRDGPNGDGQNAMPPYLWAALYDGAPLKQGSGLFRREWVTPPIYSAPALHSGRIRYWDLAASKTRSTGTRKTDRDYAVGTLMVKTREGRYVVADVVRLRGSAGDVENAILATAQRDGPGIPIQVEQEPGSNGELFANYMTRRLAGWNVTFKPSTGAKETRFAPFAAQAQARNVQIVEAAWNAPWLDELETAFVSAPHDDQADSASGAFAALCGGNPWPWLSPGPRGIVSAAMSASSSPPPSPFDSPEERELAPARHVPRPAVATSEDDADTGPRLADIRRARSGAFRGGFARELAEGGL